MCSVKHSLHEFTKECCESLVKRALVVSCKFCKVTQVGVLPYDQGYHL